MSTQPPEDCGGMAPFHGRSRDAVEALGLRCARWGTAVLTLGTLSMSLCYRLTDSILVSHAYAEMGVWMLVAQGAGLVALLLIFGPPRSGRGWSWLIVLNAWLLAVAALIHLNAIEFGVLLIVDLVLRALIVGLWSFAILGLPYVITWIWRHRHGPRSAFRFGRWWFSTLVLVLMAEPLMVVFDHDHDPLYFPPALDDPPANQLRIASIGDSTMFGHPYDPKFGIPQVLAWRIQKLYPHRQVVSENLAVPGQNLRQAVDCLRRLTFRPHLLVVYSGHNEYFHDGEELTGANVSYFGALDDVLSYSPTFRVLNLHLRQTTILRDLKRGHRRGFVELPIAGPEMRERRRRRFRHQLEQLARYGRSQEISMLWYVPAASESGFEPNRSCVRHGTTSQEIDVLHDVAERAAERQCTADWSAATDLYRAGLRRQPEFADFHFRLAECLLELNRPDEARREFQVALENDGHPVRATSPYRAAVAEVGADFSIPVVATGESLRPHTPFGILDRSLFHDNVHPTLRGFYYMGLAGVEKVVNSRTLERRFGPPATIPEADLADAIESMGIDRKDVALALRRVANGLRWLGRLRFDRKRRNQQADEYIKLAERLESGEIDMEIEDLKALR